MSALNKRNSQYIEDVCANLSKVGLASEAAALLKSKGQSKQRAQSRERRKWARQQSNHHHANGTSRSAVLHEEDEEDDDGDSTTSSGFASDTSEEFDAIPEDEPKHKSSHRASSGNEMLCSTPPTDLLPSPEGGDFTLDESRLHVVSYDAKEYLQMMESHGYGTDTDDGWRLLPLIGPTRDLVHELLDVQHAYTRSKPHSSENSPHVRSSLSRSHTATNPGQQKFWLALWADIDDPQNPGQFKQRLEILLVRCSNAGPILIGSPFDFGAANLDATALRARMLASKVKSLLPSTLQTPGGTVKYSAGSPLANIHAVIGQGALTSLFATIWSCLGQKPEPSDMQLHQTSHSPFMQTPNGVSPPPDVHMTSLSQGSVGSVPHSSTFRSRKLKLSHLPVESLPSSLDLLPGFQTRLASEKDDIKTIGRLFRDFRKALAPKGHFVNLDQSLIEARKALAENRLWIYSVYSTTCEGLSLIAGYLTVGAETDQSIAITELFTHSDYRKRNVAESLVRAVTIHYLDRAPVPKRQVVCLIPDAFDAATRVFARVGFRLGEQSRLESTLTGHEEGVKVKKGEVAPPEYSYLSWERWHEVRFESIEQGTSWHSTTV